MTTSCRTINLHGEYIKDTSRANNKKVRINYDVADDFDCSCRIMHYDQRTPSKCMRARQERGRKKRNVRAGGEEEQRRTWGTWM